MAVSLAGKGAAEVAHRFGDDVEDAICSVEERLAGVQEGPRRFVAIKLLERDDKISSQIQNLPDVSGEIERLENELKMISYNLTKGEQLESVLTSTFKEIEDITDVHQMTNTQLKRIIQKIEVDKEGNVDIYLRLLGDLGLDSTVLISDNLT